MIGTLYAVELTTNSVIVEELLSSSLTTNTKQKSRLCRRLDGTNSSWKLVHLIKRRDIQKRRLKFQFSNKWILMSKIKWKMCGDSVQFESGQFGVYQMLAIFSY